MNKAISNYDTECSAPSLDAYMEMLMQSKTFQHMLKCDIYKQKTCVVLTITSFEPRWQLVLQLVHLQSQYTETIIYKFSKQNNF